MFAISRTENEVVEELDAEQIGDGLQGDGKLQGDLTELTGTGH